MAIPHKDLYVDTIGHLGKSAEMYLSFKNYDYGKWVSEVITVFKYEKICCFGGNFGAGVLQKSCVGRPKK